MQFFKRRKFIILGIFYVVLFLLAAGGFYLWDRHHQTPSVATSTQLPTGCGFSQEEAYVGVITSISGDNVMVRDDISGAATRFVIKDYASYVGPDGIASTTSSSVIGIGQLISGSGEYYCPGNPPTLYASMIRWLPMVSDIPAPAGWYAHRMSSDEIIFTKQALLPDASSTESFAYGEQIQVSAALDLTPETWALQNIGTPSGTIEWSPASAWGTLFGHKTIQEPVEGEATTFNYVVFDGARYTAYEFILYPYPNPADMPVLNAMVRSFAQSLPSDIPETEISGKITNIYYSPGKILTVTGNDGRDYILSITSSTQIIRDVGGTVNGTFGFDSLHVGDSVTARGVVYSDGTVSPSLVEQTNSQGVD